MSHDRGCYKCGRDRWDYDSCDQKACVKRREPEPKGPDVVKKAGVDILMIDDAGDVRLELAVNSEEIEALEGKTPDEKVNMSYPAILTMTLVHLWNAGVVFEAAREVFGVDLNNLRKRGTDGPQERDGSPAA